MVSILRGGCYWEVMGNQPVRCIVWEGRVWSCREFLGTQESWDQIFTRTFCAWTIHWNHFKCFWEMQTEVGFPFYSCLLKDLATAGLGPVDFGLGRVILSEAWVHLLPGFSRGLWSDSRVLAFIPQVPFLLCFRPFIPVHHLFTSHIYVYIKICICI